MSVTSEREMSDALRTNSTRDDDLVATRAAAIRGAAAREAPEAPAASPIGETVACE